MYSIPDDDDVRPSERQVNVWLVLAYLVVLSLWWGLVAYILLSGL